MHKKKKEKVQRSLKVQLTKIHKWLRIRFDLEASRDFVVVLRTQSLRSLTQIASVLHFATLLL